MQQTAPVDELVRQAEDLVRIVVEAAVMSAERAARVCGCPGCRAQAHEAAAWAVAMLSSAQAAAAAE